MSYFDQANPAALARDFPLGDDFLERFRTLSRDELRARQETQFASAVARAWKTGFYKRLWGEQGIEPGDIRGLDDLTKLPVFDKADLMASIEQHPPYGDFSGADPETRVIVHTTSGTTGRPQTLLFGPKSREIQNLLLARVYRFQGLTDADVVHSVYGFGMINGGHYVREALLHWTNALMLPAGTGAETRSAQQVALMRDFGVTAIVGFADFIRRLADVAREQGIEPGRDIPVRLISGHLGREDRDALSAAWGGAAVYDWYGVGDTGIIAAEGPDRDGLYVMEDAHVLELLDIDSGAPVADGESGDMVATVLFKDDVYPIIRFNTHDVSALKPGRSSLDLNLRRLQGFLGRSDNMVKLRGINVFPQAIGPMLAGLDGFTGEYVCRVRRDGQGRDDMTVHVEVGGSPDKAGYEAALHQALGVGVAVEFAKPGELAPLTEVETRQKPKRLIDDRFEGA